MDRVVGAFEPDGMPISCKVNTLLTCVKHIRSLVIGNTSADIVLSTLRMGSYPR